MDANMRALRQKMIRETEAFLEQCLRDWTGRTPKPRPKWPLRTRRLISRRPPRGEAISPAVARADLRETCPNPTAAYL